MNLCQYRKRNDILKTLLSSNIAQLVVALSPEVAEYLDCLSAEK